MTQLLRASGRLLTCQRVIGLPSLDGCSIGLYGALGDRIGSEAISRHLMRAPAHAEAQVFVLEERTHPFGKRVLVAGIDQVTGLAVADHLRYPAHARGDDGLSCRHRLSDD